MVSRVPIRLRLAESEKIADLQLLHNQLFGDTFVLSFRRTFCSIPVRTKPDKIRRGALLPEQKIFLGTDANRRRPGTLSDSHVTQASLVADPETAGRS